MVLAVRLMTNSIADKEQWERFMAEVKPSTFLHSWNWGEFQVAMGNRICRLAVSDGPNLVALALFFKTVARRGVFWICPHGPIFKTGVEVKPILSLLLNFFRQEIIKNERCDFIRICSLLPFSQENQKIFQELGFRPSAIHTYSELAWISDITPEKEKLLQGMRKSTRYSIKKAPQDGVEIEKSADIVDLEKFWRIYEHTSQRQGFTPFSREYLNKEFAVFQKDNQCLLFFGRHKAEIISGAFVIFYNNSAFYHHGASLSDCSKIPAAHLVQWQAIEEAKKRGCSLYNFWGISPENEKNHPWFGLSFFKKGFGGFSEHYVHSQDLPLSPRYWLNFAIEKWRKKKRGM